MYQLSQEKATNKAFGGKINSLIQLASLNVTIPDGLILTSSEVHSLWEHKIDIKKMMLDYEEGRLSLAQMDHIVTEHISTIVFPKSIKASIGRFIEGGTEYIVRSSGLSEDSEHTSFAGQFESIPDNHSEYQILEAIKLCIKSMFSPKALIYWHQHHLPLKEFGMAILIQKQIPAEISGVAFSMNPVNGSEEEYVIEYLEGSGYSPDATGRTPYSLTLNWLIQVKLQVYDNKISCEQINEIKGTLFEIVKEIGHPIDCEFCFQNEKLYILQVRAITGFSRIVEEGSWTNANFRDGGVASQDCPDLMWSLYRDAWQISLGDYLVKNKFFKRSQIADLSRIKYARPYWNVGIVKEAMAQIPGYQEKEFSKELGLSPSADTPSPAKPSGVNYMKFIGIAVSNVWATRKRLTEAETLKSRLIEEYERLNAKINDLKQGASLEEVETIWKYIIQTAYLKSETIYFSQVFINTVQIAVKKASLLRYISDKQLLELLSNIGNVSHLRPYQRLKEIADTISDDPERIKWWKTTSTEDLLTEMMNHPLSEDSLHIIDFQEKYGYHSVRELDIREASFAEDDRIVIGLIKDILNQEREPVAVNTFKAALNVILKQHKEKINRRIEKDIRFLRKLLWWREEFKDISTRYYHLVRQSSLLLAEHYVRHDYLEEVDDIFYLKHEYIDAFMKNKIDKSELQSKARYNRNYCSAFRNFRSPDDLWSSDDDIPVSSSATKLSGAGANSGIVTGKVRILKQYTDTSSLKTGEILVTPFMDTGWSTVFPKVGGVISETGGILSHAAIVAREYGIPIIVNTKEATKRLRTGMLITIDGSQGSITIHSEQVIK